MTKMGFKFGTEWNSPSLWREQTVDELSILRKELNSVGSLNYVVDQWWKEHEQEWKEIQKQVKNDGQLFELSRANCG